MWPGFGENSRVLKWIVERLDGKAEGVETPIGVLPTKGALDTEGLELSESDLDFLLTVDKEVWREEAALVPEHLNTFGDHTPKELWDEYRALVAAPGLTPTSIAPRPVRLALTCDVVMTGRGGSFSAPAAPTRPILSLGAAPPDPRSGPERALSSIAGRADGAGRGLIFQPLRRLRSGVWGRSPRRMGRVGAAGAKKLARVRYARSSR